MVDHLATIEDREERTRAAKTVISVMGNLYPHLRDVPDFRHKLWDHLAIMSEFNLDIDTPYPLPSKESLAGRPEKLEYGSHPIQFKHYGLMTEKLIQQVKELEDEELKRILLVLTANHMKKSFLTWNKDSVEDEQIYNDIQTLHGEGIEIPEGLTLTQPKVEVGPKKGGKNPNLFANNNPNTKPQGKSGGKKNFYKKQYT
jgi:hypothetical protein